MFSLSERAAAVPSSSGKTMSTVCNHCDEDHNHHQRQKKEVDQRYYSDQEAKPTIGGQVEKKTRGKDYKKGGSEGRGGRTRINNCVDAEEQQTKEELLKSAVGGGEALPGKCIICRSNCKDINECRRGPTAIHVRCERQRGAATQTEAEQQQQQNHKYQQRPVISAVNAREEEGEEVVEMCSFRAEMSSNRSRRGSSSFFFDWGGSGRVIDRVEVERSESVACAERIQKVNAGHDPSVKGRRRKRGVSFSGSMFVLIVALFLSTTTTRTSWSVGRLLLGPGASLLVGASEVGIGNLTDAQESGVCQSIDVRNNPEVLEKLRNCRVIEGFLQILLMDKQESAKFENFTFPLLTEITDFFLVFRVTGLKSLGRMFPNLAVIRGNILFRNYALIVFESFQLEEIALKSLKYIGRGAVRIEKNPTLCFSQSVDWTHLMNGTHHEANDFLSNRKDNECPVCPGGNASESHNCPVLAPAYPKRYACWNLTHCQVTCPAQCPWNCDELGNCCAKMCLGGCAVGNSTNCAACNHYSLGDRPHRQCVDECPDGYYRHMGRRCITKQECLSIRRPFNMPHDTPAKPYIPYRGECRLTCPEGFREDRVNRTCAACSGGVCKKICAGAKIDNIQAAQQMADCQVVTGTLEIQIRREGGLSVVNELSRFLAKIEEIEGHLKISRSDPLISLSFLKNLRVIKGIGQDGRPKKPDEPSFTLTENDNLQDLFGTNQTVEIHAGLLNFHTNPKLCVNRIESLQGGLGPAVKFDLQSFKSSNGDRVACDLIALNPKVQAKSSRLAFITFPPLKEGELDDDRSLLGYVIHYKPAPSENVTLFDGRDACGFDGWMNDDIGVSPKEENPQFVLTHLEPFTQYAFYVKTVQLAAATKGGESNISYFTTEPDQPEMVRNLKVLSSESHSLTLVWDPPYKANGLLTSYIITATAAEENAEYMNQRNYCTQKWDATLNNPSLPPTPAPEKFPDKLSGQDSCECQKEAKLQTPAEAENMIQFEDALHNYVYVKRMDDDAAEMSRKRRRRRSIDLPLGSMRGADNVTDVDVFPTKINNTVATVTKTESEKDAQGRYTYFYGEVDSNTTSLKIPTLKHFTAYSITVVACREGEGTNCSMAVIVSHRTEMKEGADEIRGLKILGNPKNNSHNLLSLTWEPPVEPNGMVLTYTIKYTNKDIENGIGQLTCIRAVDFETQKREYKLKLGAENGNYSVEVQVTGLGGPGEYSDAIYYRIENPDHTWWIVLVVLSIILSLFGALVYYFYQNKKREKDHKLFAEVNPDYDATPYIPDEYEIPRERVKRLQELGQGSFGLVYAGTVQLKEDDPTETQCAIKTVNDAAMDRERVRFLKEAHVMKEFHTPHVVQLLGVVSKGDPPLVVMELMGMGDLKGYLRAHRSDADPGLDGEAPVPPSVRQILQMAIEIADGMAYLSYKKFVHRDLAARNCMVGDDLTVKIGDFGMTRDIYETDYYRKGDKGLLPVRWMSPESLKDGIFTTSNDVFSYGVVLWEMATLASQPYQGLSNDQVLRYVIDGGVMERPENCPEKIYQLMRRCWQHRPSSRPTFLDIVAMLLEDVDPTFYRSSFYFSEEGESHRYMLQNDGHHPDEGTTLLRPENEMSHENARHENWDMPNNNNNSRRLLEEGGAMPIIKPAQSPLRFLTGKSGNDYKESKF